ncbi:Ig-like domain-containing protein [Paenibacillus pasadenensis]|nr:Ig-like domain-containing protein [Paenibacillus pasadenensis]MCM3749045.1 Ig-like domain-containing protein [Paenibacillus pasadenensis]
MSIGSTRRQLASILAIMMLLFSVRLPMDAAVYAAEAALPSFKASEGFSNQQGANQWRYQYRIFNSSEFKDLPTNVGNTWWRANQNWDWGKVAGIEVTPGSQADTSRTFVAPKSGTVKLSAAKLIAINPGTYGGARLKILKNETQIWPTTGEWEAINANQTVTFPELTAQVTQGDRIYFIVNSGADHVNGQDDVTWDPVVSYTEVTEAVSPTSVTLDQHELTLNVDDTVQLNATVAPENATNKNLIWSSSNPSVATVVYGSVTAVSSGTAVITVTTMDGGLTDSATVVSAGFPAFKASEGFSATQGADNWRYQYRLLNSSSYVDLPTFAGNSWWKTSGNWDLGRISGSEMTPGTQADTSRTFISPATGTMVIKAHQITIHQNTFDGAQLKIMKNGTQIWPAVADGEWKPIASKQQIDFPDLSVSVIKGDRIYFISNSGKDKSNGYDDLIWDPVIKFTEIVNTVSPASVTLNQEQLTPGIGEKITLQATIAPADALNKNLYWTTSNPQVASVDENGLVTVNGPGTAIITVETADGALKDQAEIVVDGEGALTKVELLYMVSQMLKLPSVPYEGIFSDVTAENTSADMLQSAYDNELIDSNLIVDGKLNPNAPLTREQAASILINGYNRAMEQDAQLGDISSLSDLASISDWAVDYVKADSKLGIVATNDPYPAQFGPQASLTRMEAFDMVKRLVGVMDIQSMINAAIAAGKSKVVIPPNTYRIGEEAGNVLISISNANNLEIVADGVTVIGTKLTKALNIENSKNVKISGMVINYDPLPFTQGKVKVVAADLSYVDIELAAGYPRKLYSRLSIYDQETNFQKHGINHLWGTSAAWNEDGTVRIKLNGVGRNVDVGDPVTLAGGPGPGGIPHGVTVGGSSGIVFKNFTIHTAPGFGFLEAGSEGGTVLDGFKLIPGPPPPGGTEKPLLTAVWDGVQFKTSKKGPIVENSTIYSAGDDSFSIQSGDYGVVKAQGDEIHIVLRDGSQGVKAGDRLRDFNKNGSEAIVVSVEHVTRAAVGMDAALLQKIVSAADWTPWRFTEETYYKIKLDRQSPFQAEQFIFSPDRMANGFVFKNNDVYSPGRGMLLKAGDGLIEGNTFRGGDKAIIVSPEVVTDSHAGAANNLIIRNNKIIGTGYHHYMPWSDQSGSIGFAAGNVKSELAFDNILIEGNTFDNVNGLNLNLTGVGNATVKNNKFLKTHLTEPNNNGADKGIDPTSVILVKNAENITFSGNTIDRMGIYSTLPVNVQEPASGIVGADTGVTILNPAPLNTLSQVTLSVDSPKLQPEKTATARVSGKLSSGVPTSLIGAVVTYTSSNPNVATIDAGGKITAVAVGTTVIKATVKWNGFTVQAQDVTVKVALPLYTGAPGKPVLSSNIAQANGLKDGNYTVTMNMWWGNNGDVLKVYENGVLISTQALDDASPKAQTAKVEVKGNKNGTYTYTAELVNSLGTTKSDPLVVTVTDAAPGKPVLSHDNWDGDGSFKLTMNMWWGTNGTEYRLYENGVLIETKALTANSPSAQQAVKSLTGRAKGVYEYRIELVNAAGTTSSDVLKVNVTK